MANTPKNIQITLEMMNVVTIPKSATPSEFVKICWSWYKENYASNNSINGTMLENIIELALRRAGVEEIFTQVELSFVPFAIFDIMLFEDGRPLALPVKTTIRERWKQADMEAQLLKQVHRNAECILLTISEDEVNARRNDTEQTLGIDRFVLADTPEFDELVELLLTKTFIDPGVVPVITKSKVSIGEAII